METTLRAILIFSFFTLVYSQRKYDVTSFGARGDGRADDTKAFTKAWDAVCGARNSSIMVIPKNKTFLLNIIEFEGPCKSDVEIRVDGNIIAPNYARKRWRKLHHNKWLSFKDVNGLRVIGNGEIYARGEKWWNKKCRQERGCGTRPTTLSINGCSNFLLRGLTSRNSAKNHISVSSCANGTLESFSLFAPKSSPNTDGIDISESINITINNSTIATGDDCVAINHGCSRIFITGMNCGPGHGISVGSLGRNGGNATVKDIIVKNCTFKGTQNGARIKSWQGGRGYARNITYEDIIMINSENPIFIDQYYCPHQRCKIEDSAVKISDISYINIHGTTPDENVIDFSCSQSISCTNILVQNVNITSSRRHRRTYSHCVNVYGNSTSSIPKVDCMLD